MTKSLGQIASEAWHLVIRESGNRWRRTDREAWQAAAGAVMHEVIHGVQWDYMPPQVRAVVEAARAMERQRKLKPGGHPAPDGWSEQMLGLIDEFQSAVEALEKETDFEFEEDR